MKLQIKNSDGSVVFYPTNPPSPKVGYTIVDVTPEIQAVIDAGGPFRWVFETETQTRFGQTREVVVGGYLEKVEKTLEELKAAKVKELEQARWNAEIAGTTVPELNDAPVLTDKETQNELGKALALLTVNPNFEIDWRFPHGEIVRLNGDSIKQVASVVFTHVQSTRTRFKVLMDQISEAETIAEVNLVVW